jgi:hypothetical protein
MVILEWETILAPIFTSMSWMLESDQCETSFGSAKRRPRAARRPSLPLPASYQAGVTDLLEFLVRGKQAAVHDLADCGAAYPGKRGQVPAVDIASFHYQDEGVSGSHYIPCHRKTSHTLLPYYAANVRTVKHFLKLV